MRARSMVLIATLLGFVAGTAAAAESAGIVKIAEGTISVTRDGAVLPVTPGFEGPRTGDIVRASGCDDRA